MLYDGGESDPGTEKRVAFLLENGAEIRDHVIFIAIDRSNDVCLELLLKHGAVDSSSLTP